MAESTSWWDAVRALTFPKACDTKFLQVFMVFGLSVHVVCRWILTRLAQPDLGPNGELIDAGADLSDNYISEYVDYLLRA